MPNMLNELGDLLKQIQAPERTNGAQVIVVGYPKLFPEGGHDGCNGINPARQVRLNQATDRVDDAIRSKVGEMPGATFLPVGPVLVGHEICGATAESYINDLQLNVSGSVPVLLAPRLLVPATRNNCPPDR